EAWTLYCARDQRCIPVRQAKSCDCVTGTPKPTNKENRHEKKNGKITQADVLEIAKRTVVLSLSFSGPGDVRRIDSKSIDVKGETEDKKADKNWISASKQLFDSKEYDAIWSIDGKVHQYVQNTALP